MTCEVSGLRGGASIKIRRRKVKCGQGAGSYDEKVGEKLVQGGKVKYGQDEVVCDDNLGDDWLSYVQISDNMVLNRMVWRTWESFNLY